MTTARSCVVEVLHRDGVPIALVPQPAANGRSCGRSCGDCGVSPGGWHHPGCDLQRCPQCHGQLFSCGCHFDEFGDGDDFFDDDDDHDDDDESPYGVDGNGLLTERRIIAGVKVIVHYCDIPDSDFTTVDGIRCTTALRTLIDVACDLTPADLVAAIRDGLQRQLFTLDDAHLDSPRPTWRSIAVRTSSVQP